MDFQTFLQTPIGTASAFCAFVIVFCWAASVITGNYSWVDRSWSVVPPLYVGWFAWQSRFTDARTTVMAVLVLLWGARLTYNFARKGGYKRGHEDYRWPILRQRLGKTGFQIFNATFIAPYQSLLVFAFTLPAAVTQQNPTPFTLWDAALTVAFLLFLAGETVADQQQWNFHQHKHAAQARGEKVEPPFLTTGLFRYSRHPNFFCEQAQWWVIYLFSVSATGAWFNLSISGALLLTLLFIGSTQFTEAITKSKYPSYADYQRRTSRLIPLPPRG